MLTKEQRESVRYASEWLGRSEDIGNQKHAARLRTLLAGAQPKGTGMQAQMIASRICSALEADKDDGYDLEAGLFGKVLSALIRELVAMSLSDGARDAKDAKRYRLLREHYFARADNPNTSAYHCVGIFASWMHAPTIDREGLDAAIDAEIERIAREKGER